MNETVKAALLDRRETLKRYVESTERDLAGARRQVASLERGLVPDQQRLADIELHLRDNGVDLAAVDAEAARKQSAMQCAAGINQTNVLGGNYGRALSSLNGDLSNQLRGSRNELRERDTFDPTAGLAKALDEA